MSKIEKKVSWEDGQMEKNTELRKAGEKVNRKERG